MKTISPRPESRMLGLDGSVLDNILGNRDGEVLDDLRISNRKRCQSCPCSSNFPARVYPDLYGDFSHGVRITTIRRAAITKELDNIDLFGWLGYKMQIKIDFLCRDSILAAPLALDLALFMDLAQRRDERRSEWLLVLFQSTATRPGLLSETRSVLRL